MLASLLLALAAATSTADSPAIQPVPFTAVKLTDTFWAPRVAVTRRVTIPACFKQCEATGRIANFDRAAGTDKTPFQGNCYDDSDVYKVIEGAAYCLAQSKDAEGDRELDAYLDQLIDRITKAQESDGYLYTIATANKKPKDARWKDERWSHETYCAGHLFEAAVAHHQATGKTALLDVATKFADLLVAEFLRGDRTEVPGHQEVEIGLVRLYRETGKKDYLDLARAFLVRRGSNEGRERYGDYCQDHQPLLEQREAIGHAVRAGYLYSGMADVAAVTGEHTFDEALDAIWKDCIGTKLYLTGGIGALAQNEGFGKPYELPNESAYSETCASIANCLWNERMFLRSGSSDPVDVLERTLYNAVPAGVALSGDKFFYPNPLACDGVRPFNHGTLGRAPWFGCACCPVNVARFLPSVSGYVYATSEKDNDATIYANLFVQSDATIPLKSGDVRIEQKTTYPWTGTVEFKVDPGPGTPGQGRAFTLAIRAPGWARGRAVPGDLYTYVKQHGQVGPIQVSVNHAREEEVNPNVGYIRIARTWQRGDTVMLTLPLDVHRVEARSEIESDRGRVALERGPLVYCVEAGDIGGAGTTVRDVYLTDDVAVRDQVRSFDQQPINVLVADAKRAGGGAAQIVAIPYAYWANRDVGEMQVWIPRSERDAEVVPPPTLASRATTSASHTWVSDTHRALNDRRVPKSSGDGTIPRHTWWDKKGSVEWVQYEWLDETSITSASVYFFDDSSNGGGCALPKGWRLLAQKPGSAEWTPIEARYEVKRDAPCVVKFAPVTTKALRLEVALQPGHSGGVLEWGVE